MTVPDASPEYKKHVVDMALSMARKHDMCSEVERTLVKMGLSEFIPTVYNFQWKDKANGRWQMNHEADSYSSVDKAQREAKRFADFRNSGAVRSSYVFVYSGQDEETVLRSVKDKLKALNEGIGEGVVTRIVKRVGGKGRVIPVRDGER